MVSFGNLFTALSVVAICAAELHDVHIYHRSLDSHAKHEWGILRYQDESKRAQFKTTGTQELAPGPHCLGTTDIPHHECFSVIQDVATQLTVFINSDGGIDGLSAATNSRKTDAAPHIVVSLPQIAPTPNKNPAVSPEGSKKSKPATEKITRKRTVKKTDENGNEEEVVVEETFEVPVDERSWIQKYWWYFTLPLIFLMIVGTDDKKE